MSAIIGVALLAAAALIFAAIRAYFPDRPGESDVGELAAQLLCVLITGLLCGGLAGLVDFAATHQSATGLLWLALAVAATLAAFVLAARIGRGRARAA